MPITLWKITVLFTNLPYYHKHCLLCYYIWNKLSERKISYTKIICTQQKRMELNVQVWTEDSNGIQFIKLTKVLRVSSVCLCYFSLCFKYFSIYCKIQICQLCISISISKSIYLNILMSTYGKMKGVNTYHL